MRYEIPTTVTVCLRPTGLHSTAMLRVATALRKSLPRGFVEVHRPEKADIQFLHLIDVPKLDHDRKYVALQYCLRTTQWSDPSEWEGLWHGMVGVYSYYDLSDYVSSAHFLHAPLGIDSVFLRHEADNLARHRSPHFVTTGYVTGPGAEAIEEVWNVADRMGISGVHVGPRKVEGMKRELPKGWRQCEGITDEHMAYIHSTASHVFSLRHVEGFELPAAEGIACGARAVVFDQPTLRHWYRDAAIYVPESHGPSLESHLQRVVELTTSHRYYDLAERRAMIERMNWEKITSGLWDMVVRNFFGA